MLVLSRTHGRARQGRTRPGAGASSSAWRWPSPRTTPSARWRAGTRWSQDRDGEPLGSAAAARTARELRLRFHDGAVGARVDEEERE